MQNERIAELNDLLRKTFIGGRIVITAGIAALPEGDQAAILVCHRHVDRDRLRRHLDLRVGRHDQGGGSERQNGERTHRRVHISSSTQIAKFSRRQCHGR